MRQKKWKVERQSQSKMENQQAELNELKQMWEKGELDNLDWKPFPYCDLDCGNETLCIYLKQNGIMVCKKCLVKPWKDELGKPCDDCSYISKDTRIIPLNTPTASGIAYKRLCRDCISLLK